jgi:hypothetical protein
VWRVDSILKAPGSWVTAVRENRERSTCNDQTMKIDLVDGLYRVQTSYLCAGFFVLHGQVVACAPILKPNLPRWIRIARKVA